MYSTGAPSGWRGFPAQELQLVEVLFLPPLLFLQPAPQVDVRAVPDGHLIAVAAMEKQLAVHEVPNRGRFLFAAAVASERESQQAVPCA